MHSGLNNSELQTSSTSAIQRVKTYDAFGNLVASSGTWSGPFGYAGGFGYQEDATGLKLLGHRYYDSSTGRFLTRDPIKDGRNWYVYCHSNPVTFADPNGLRAWFSGRVINRSDHDIWVFGDTDMEGAPGTSVDGQPGYVIKPGETSPDYIDADAVFDPVRGDGLFLHGVCVAFIAVDDGFIWSGGLPVNKFGYGQSRLEMAYAVIAAEDYFVHGEGQPAPGGGGGAGGGTGGSGYRDPEPLPGMPKRTGSNPLWN
jgi:RHS repeat-associated protein